MQENAEHSSRDDHVGFFDLEPAHPLTLFNQIPLHVTDRGDRPTEPDGAQLQKIGEDPTETDWLGVAR